MRPSQMPFIDYLNAVDDLLQTRYGITSNDAALEEIARAQEDESTPEEFVEWFGNHYDLDRIDLNPFTGQPLEPST